MRKRELTHKNVLTIERILDRPHGATSVELSSSLVDGFQAIDKSKRFKEARKFDKSIMDYIIATYGPPRKDKYGDIKGFGLLEFQDGHFHKTGLKTGIVKLDELLEKEVQRFPTVSPGIKRLFDLYNRTQDLKSIERLLLRGNGLSSNTYESYLSAVKQFYEFTNHLHPFEVSPKEIEKYYDDMIVIRKVNRATAVLRIAGLRKFFKQIEKNVPCYTTPFYQMSEELIKKLTRVKENKLTACLSKIEFDKVLDYLKSDMSLKGLQNLAIIWTIGTTGLRITELCGMKWSGCEWDSKHMTYFLNGTGRGSKPFRQMVFNPAAIDAAKKAYTTQKGKIDPTDWMFYSTSNYTSKIPAPINPSISFKRIRKVGETIRHHDPHSVWYQLRRIGTMTEKGGVVIRQTLRWNPNMFRKTAINIFYEMNGKDIIRTKEFGRLASLDNLNDYLRKEQP